MYDNWYAVQVRSGQEEEIIKKCEILIHRDIYHECFIPRYKHMKKFRGKWHEIEDILFKGYIFIITDHVDELFIELKKIPDLTRLLGNDGENIYPIYKEEAKFLSQFGGKQHIVNMSIGYIEGDIIHIDHGPLMGYEGHITKIDRHKRIAYVGLSLFGRQITVKIGLEIISKI